MIHNQITKIANLGLKKYLYFNICFIWAQPPKFNKRLIHCLLDFLYNYLKKLGFEMAN